MDNFDKLIQIEKWFKEFTLIQRINLIRILKEKIE